jgi:hypothetical protein
MFVTTQDYIHFIDVLKRKWASNIANIGILEDAFSNLRDTENQYTINKLMFTNINLGRNRRPGGKISESVCELFLDIKLNNLLSDNIVDPFEKYTMFFKLVAEVSSLGNHNEITKCCWHLDKDDGKSIDFIHPLYHLQYGGHEIVKDTDFRYGNFLLIEAPRVMHPPLDIILAIDFIINNFYSAESRKILQKERNYLKVVEKAKKQFWKPYALAFASNFDKIEDVDTKFAKKIIG